MPCRVSQGSLLGDKPPDRWTSGESKEELCEDHDEDELQDRERGGVTHVEIAEALDVRVGGETLRGDPRSARREHVVDVYQLESHNDSEDKGDADARSQEGRVPATPPAMAFSFPHAGDP